MRGEITNQVLRWIYGTERIKDLNGFLAEHGNSYRNYRNLWALGIREMPANDQAYFNLSLAAHRERISFISNFGFSLPIREALDALAQYEPLLEIGAGTGYWAALLDNENIDVVATDAKPRGTQSTYGFTIGSHFPTLRYEGKTAVRHWKWRNVFCSWPSLNETWFRQAVKAMRIGRTLIVVREGACAEDTAWEYIEANFELIQNIEIPCFNGLHDWIEIRVKKHMNRKEETNADSPEWPS